jgi:hypothetical protein
MFGCDATHLHAGWSDYRKIIEILDGLPEERPE